MLTHPDFNPVALQLGPLSIKWYGLMYLVAFGLFFYLGRHRARTQPWYRVDLQVVDDFLLYGVLGVIIGGRLGYVLFYKPGYYASHLFEIIEVWMGGMSFHGGFLGALVAIWLVSRKHKLGWWRMADFVAPLVPCGLAAGRMGNFINGELWGRVTDVPWGMVFKHASGGPRHPSQLYQFALEGLALFVILWIYSAKRRPAGAVSAVFLIGYGVFRFIAEYFREPDDFLGLLTFGMSMGQWLSLPMIAAGIMLFTWAYRREEAAT